MSKELELIKNKIKASFIATTADQLYEKVAID